MGFTANQRLCLFLLVFLEKIRPDMCHMSGPRLISEKRAYFFFRTGPLAGGSSQRGFPIGTQRIGPLPSQRRTQHTFFGCGQIKNHVTSLVEPGWPPGDTAYFFPRGPPNPCQRDMKFGPPNKKLCCVQKNNMLCPEPWPII